MWYIMKDEGVTLRRWDQLTIREWWTALVASCQPRPS